MVIAEYLGSLVVGRRGRKPQAKADGKKLTARRQQEKKPDL